MSPKSKPGRRPPSSVQTTRPLPDTSYSNSPKIGGSEAAFIVLVIVLAFIVIFASIAIYFLLRRDGESSAAGRATRRKYSAGGSGGRKHFFPIGLPGSLSEKIGSVFKGRRTGAGWVPAKDEADEWDSTDEPLPAYHHPDLPYDAPLQKYPRVGSAAPSRRTTLTEASESLHKSRMASHVEDPSEEDFDRDRPPYVHVQAPTGPDEVWLNAHDGSRGGLGSVGTDTRHMDYYAPQPHRADSGPEVPLFAGSVPFRQDMY